MHVLCYHYCNSIRLISVMAIEIYYYHIRTNMPTCLESEVETMYFSSKTRH